MEHSNPVGNIYFSHYYTWHAQVLDQFLYDAGREYFLSDGMDGEFRCTHCRINHMNEAMPFDRIAVSLHRSTVHQQGIRLTVNCYRLSPDGRQNKLGYGEHTATWHAPDKPGVWRPADIPERILNFLRPKGKGSIV